VELVAKVHRLPSSCFPRYLCTMLSESHPILSSSEQNKLSVGPVKSNIKNKVPRKGMDGDTMVIKLAKKVMWYQITSGFHAFLSFRKKILWMPVYPNWLFILASQREISFFFTAFVSLLPVLT